MRSVYRATTAAICAFLTGCAVAQGVSTNGTMLADDLTSRSRVVVDAFENSSNKVHELIQEVSPSPDFSTNNQELVDTIAEVSPRTSLEPATNYTDEVASRIEGSIDFNRNPEKYTRLVFFDGTETNLLLSGVLRGHLTTAKQVVSVRIGDSVTGLDGFMIDGIDSFDSGDGVVSIVNSFIGSTVRRIRFGSSLSSVDGNSYPSQANSFYPVVADEIDFGDSSVYLYPTKNGYMNYPNSTVTSMVVNAEMMNNGRINYSEQSSTKVYFVNIYTNLKSVSFSKSVTHISNGLFRVGSYWKGSIKRVRIPKSVSVIGDSCFSGNSELDSVDFESMPDFIGGGAFSGTGFEHLNLNNDYKFGGGVFQSCASLKSVNLDGLRNVPENTFNNCYSLTNTVYIPDSVTNIGRHAFWQTRVRKFDIGINTKIDGVAFERTPSLTNINFRFPKSIAVSMKGFPFGAASGVSFTFEDDVYVPYSGTNSVSIGTMNHVGTRSLAVGTNNYATGANSFSSGRDNTASGASGIAVGRSNLASGSFSIASGTGSVSSNTYSYVWNRSLTRYGSHGNGTYNINPVNGIYGFFIGDSTLYDIFASALSRTNEETAVFLDENENETSRTFQPLPVMRQSDIAPLQNSVNAMWATMYGESVWIAVTNYMRQIAGTVPSLRLWEVRDNTTNLVYSSAEEIEHITTQKVNAAKSEIKGIIPRTAWGSYQSSGEENPSSNAVTVVNSEKVMLTGGGKWYKAIETGGRSLWVLKFSGLQTVGGDTNGFFRVCDAEGNSQLEVVKTADQIVSAIPQDTTFVDGEFTVTFNSGGSTHPTASCALDLGDDFETEDGSGNINSLGISVEWNKNSDNLWVATIHQDNPATKLFVYAKALQQGENLVRNNAPTSLEGGIYINNVKYRLVPYATGGKTYLTLEAYQ